MMVTRAPGQFHERHRVIIPRGPPVKLQPFQARAVPWTAKVRTGEIGNKRTGVMGYSSKHYVFEECEPYGRDDSICDVSAKRAIYRERTVRAVWHQPQDRL